MTEQTDTNLTVNHVVAVINGEAPAQKAGNELVAAGYKAPQILTGEDGATQINSKGQAGGIFSRLMRTVEDHLSDSTNFLAQYEDEARSGKQVVAVEVPNREEADRAHQILDRNGAENVRFFGRLAVADLTPETNPNVRAEAPAPQAPAQ